MAALSGGNGYTTEAYGESLKKRIAEINEHLTVYANRGRIVGQVATKADADAWTAQKKALENRVRRMGTGYVRGRAGKGTLGPPGRGLEADRPLFGRNSLRPTPFRRRWTLWASQTVTARRTANFCRSMAGTRPGA